MIILLEIHEQTTSPEKLERAQYLMALNLAQYQFPTWVLKGWKLKQFWHNIKSDLIPSNWALMSSSRGGCTSLCLQERTGSWNLTRHLVRIVTRCLIFSVTIYEFPSIESGTVPMPVGRRWQKARKPWEVQIWWGENSGPPEDFRIRNLLSFLNFPFIGDVGCGCSTLVSRSRFPFWG